MMQYSFKLKYEDGHEGWELSKGSFANEQLARANYEEQGKALGFVVLEVKAHQQFEFKF